MNEILQDTIIQLLGIIIGGALSVASSYCALFVARATKKIKIEIEKLDDEKQVEIQYQAGSQKRCPGRKMGIWNGRI